ncbi:MAG: hypothetical protein MZV70_71840 [Desulfobacterales bacterium]|nr:hypothetical protein [Desulfobacterales bacterium]
MIGDLGQPDWDYRPVPDVYGESPYAMYPPVPYPQHVRGPAGAGVLPAQGPDDPGGQMKKLLALAVVLVGALGAYHALMFYDNNFRYGRMRETPAVKPHEEPLIRMEAGVVPVSGGEAVLRATPGRRSSPPGAGRRERHRPGQGRLLHLLRAVPRPELRRQRHRGAELHAASDRFALLRRAVQAGRGAFQERELRHPRRPPAAAGDHHHDRRPLERGRLRQVAGSAPLI